MHLSGMADKEIKETLLNWNKNCGSSIDEEKLNRIIEDTLKHIIEQRLYEKLFLSLIKIGMKCLSSWHRHRRMDFFLQVDNFHI
jgi:hypothetical protein